LRLLVSLFRNAFHRVYLTTYFKHSPHPRAELKGWLLPVTFARLSEDIETERPWLVREVCGMLGVAVPEVIAS